MLTAEERALIEESARELAAKMVTPMHIIAAATTVFQLVGLLQLALRHPGVSSDLRAAAERFLQGAREYFDDCPATLSIVLRGDDPSEDV